MTDEQLPPPLVPPDTDLNGYAFMPLHGELLFRSSFNANATDAEFRAAIRLWWAAWHEVPAASLPNDERAIARMAGVTDMRRWRHMRDRILCKWVLSADYRLYHPVLSVLALQAFAKRKTQSIKGRIGAQKRWENKDATDGTANATANATAIHTNGTGYRTGNSKRSERDTPKPPRAFAPTSTTSPAAHSLARAEQTKREMAEALARSALPPGVTKPSDLLAKFKTRQPFDDDPEETPASLPATPSEPREGIAT